MKAIWTGSLGFGLVNIPVKLYSAVEESSLDLDMLDKKDHSNIKYKRVNEKTGKEVAWENIVKGYMLNSKYVILGKEDFEKAAPERTKHIGISQFVKLAEIDPNYFEMPYFLEPEKTGVRAYALLRDALKKSGKAAVGSFVMRDREHLCVISAQDNALVLHRIRFAQELRSPKDLKIPSTKTSAAELKMAMSLITQLTKKFDITSFKDEYTSKLMKLIRAKSKGKSIKTPQMRVVHSKSDDLMEQLKASLSSPKRKVS